MYEKVISSRVIKWWKLISHKSFLFKSNIKMFTKENKWYPVSIRIYSLTKGVELIDWNGQSIHIIFKSSPLKPSECGIHSPSYNTIHPRYTEITKYKNFIKQNAILFALSSLTILSVFLGSTKLTMNGFTILTKGNFIIISKIATRIET